MINILPIDTGDDNTIVMQMTERDEILCEGKAVIQADAAYIKEVGHNEFSADIARALLNAIDLRGIQEVVWHANNSTAAAAVGFEQTERGLYLNLNGYFAKKCN